MKQTPQQKQKKIQRKTTQRKRRKKKRSHTLNIAAGVSWVKAALKSGALILLALVVTTISPKALSQAGYRFVYDVTGFVSNDLKPVQDSWDEVFKGDTLMIQNTRLDREDLYYVSNVRVHAVSVKNLATGLQYEVRR